MRTEFDDQINDFEEKRQQGLLNEAGIAFLNSLKEMRINAYGRSFEQVKATLDATGKRLQIQIVQNFLTNEECKAIIEYCQYCVQPSNVLGTPNNNYRTSSDIGLIKNPHNPPELNNIIDTIKIRIASLTNLPIENQENFVVIRYNIGEEYVPHHDYFSGVEDDISYLLNNGGERIVTVLMCLQAPEGGGETEFSVSKHRITQQNGQAVVWRNGNREGTEMYKESQHAGLPVLKGTKWMMTCWIRTKQTTNGN